MAGKIHLLALGMAIVIIVSMYYFFFSQEVVAPTTEKGEGIEIISPPRDTAVSSIPVLHTYSKGTHKVSGSVTLPTPCYTLHTEVQISSTTPSEALILFSSGDPGGMCIQIIDRRPFEVSFKAPEEMLLQGLWNGSEILITEDVE